MLLNTFWSLYYVVK